MSLDNLDQFDTIMTIIGWALAIVGAYISITATIWLCTPTLSPKEHKRFMLMIYGVIVLLLFKGGLFIIRIYYGL